MAFVIDPAYLSAILTADPMTDEQSAELCSAHSDLSFEVTAEGDLIVNGSDLLVDGISESEDRQTVGYLGRAGWAGDRLRLFDGVFVAESGAAVSGCFLNAVESGS